MSFDAARIVKDFESGRITRRQLVAQLMALGAAAAGVGTTALAQDQPDGGPTFQATGLDHVALRVSDVRRSVEFYQKHLGLSVMRQSENSAFLNPGDNEFLALFRREPAGLDHYCYNIRNYDPDEVVRELEAAGLDPRRESNRVYFDDPDGIEVQLAGGE